VETEAVANIKVVYVAGPFRSASAYVPGHQDGWGIQCNVMAAMALALEVWRLGAVAVCPHANAMFFQNAAPDAVWLAGDIELMKRCDAVIFTADWMLSSGARAEQKIAEDLGMPLFYNIASLKHWLET
jgi:hypothetical protein